MANRKFLHAIVWQEGKLFVAKLLEIELASQGETKNQALANLKEALELYLEGEKISNLRLPPVGQIGTYNIPLT